MLGGSPPVSSQLRLMLTGGGVGGAELGTSQQGGTGQSPVMDFAPVDHCQLLLPDP